MAGNHRNTNTCVVDRISHSTSALLARRVSVEAQVIVIALGDHCFHSQVLSDMTFLGVGTARTDFVVGETVVSAIPSSKTPVPEVVTGVSRAWYEDVAVVRVVTTRVTRRVANQRELVYNSMSDQ